MATERRFLGRELDLNWGNIGTVLIVLAALVTTETNGVWYVVVEKW